MDKIMSDKERLIAHLEILRDAEESKPVNEKDNELIRACIVLLLDLQGKKLTLTEEEIEERVRNFPFVAENKGIDNQKNTEGKNKKVSKKKVLLVAACIAILVALFSIASIAFKWNIFEELKNRFGTVADTPVYEQQDVNGVTVVMSGQHVNYLSVDEALEADKLNVLYPNCVSNDIKITEIARYQYNSKECLTYIFSRDDITCEVTLDADLDISKKELAGETAHINGKTCYFFILDDESSVQIYFEYKNNVYMFNGCDKQLLIEMIENLEEANYEN